MADSMSGIGEIQYKPECLVGPENKDVLKKEGKKTPQEDTGANLKKLPPNGCSRNNVSNKEIMYQ